MNIGLNPGPILLSLPYCYYFTAVQLTWICVLHGCTGTIHSDKLYISITVYYYWSDDWLRAKIRVYSAMVISVLHGAAESWTLSRTQLSRLETLHNSWLRCITRDTVGRPDSISTKDLMEKTHQLPISVMIKERRLTCATCWTALWHLDALCYEGCEGHGSANGLPQPRMELAERSHEHTYLGRYCWWSQAVLTFS